jgi:methylisocitrate lyase
MKSDLSAKSAAMSARLRKLMAGNCIPMPGAFNAATALLIEQAGFPAVYVSGAGLSNAALGVPDVGLLTLPEVAQLSQFIAAAVDIPVLVDADTGFGDPARTVRNLIRAGVAAAQFEDQVAAKRCGHLAGKKLVTASAMVNRIASAARGRGRGKFVIVARTDARAVEGFNAAIDRAQKYLAAGADCIFPEALQTESEFAEFARKIRAPLLANITEFGKSPLLDIAKLSKLGYRIAIFPQTAFRVAMRAEQMALADLKKHGSQKNWLPKMQTRRELYDLLRYNPQKGTWKGKPL